MLVLCDSAIDKLWSLFRVYCAEAGDNRLSHFCAMNTLHLDLPFNRFQLNYSTKNYLLNIKQNSVYFCIYTIIVTTVVKTTRPRRRALYRLYNIA